MATKFRSASSTLKHAPRALGALFCAVALLASTACQKKAGSPDWESTASAAPASSAPTPASEPASPTAPRTSKPQELNGPTLRFINYNVENWLTMDRYVDQKLLKGSPKPESEKQAVIEILSRHTPDVIGLCEIGTAADLAEIQERLKAKGLDLPHSHHTGGADPTRHLGLLSRFPITSTAKPERLQFQLEGTTFAMGRGILDASLAAHGKNYRFIGVHLKSKRDSDLGDQEAIRQNEARLLREHVNSILSADPQARIAVYGDFNDTRATRSVRTITGSYNDPTYLTAIPAKDSKQHAWTHHWAPHDIYSRIDFTMVNRALRSDVDFPAAKIIDDEGWEKASDHRPILAIFR
jgi:endonuclease/exonuclease/phosphatase family metal-dependent hydrolase